jgi:hypothetical protein
MLMTVDAQLIESAYQVGRGRGTSLAAGYYVSPDGGTVFVQNPNSPEGVFVGVVGGFGDLPGDYLHFDMSDALAAPVDA